MSNVLQWCSNIVVVFIQENAVGLFFNLVSTCATQNLMLVLLSAMLAKEIDLTLAQNVLYILVLTIIIFFVLFV